MNILIILYKKIAELFINGKFQVFFIFVFFLIIGLRHIKNDLPKINKNLSIHSIQNELMTKIIKNNPQVISELTENNSQRRSNNLDIVQMGDEVKIEMIILNLDNQYQQSQRILDYIKIGDDDVLTKYLIDKKIGNEITISAKEIAKQSRDSTMGRFDNSKIFYKIKILSINEKK